MALFISVWRVVKLYFPSISVQIYIIHTEGLLTWQQQPPEAQYQNYTKEYNRVFVGLQRFELRTWPLTNYTFMRITVKRVGKAGGSQI